MLNEKKQVENNQQISELYQLIQEGNKKELAKRWQMIKPEIFVTMPTNQDDNRSILSRLCEEGNIDYIRYIIDNPYMIKAANYRRIMNDFITYGALWACKAPNLDVLKYIASCDVKAKYIFHSWKGEGLNHSKAGQNLMMFLVIKELLISTYPKEDVMGILGSWLKNKDNYLPQALKFYTLKRVEDNHEDLTMLINEIKKSNPKMELWFAHVLNGTLIDEYDFPLITSVIEMTQMNVEELKSKLNNDHILRKLWLNMILKKELEINKPQPKGKI